MSSLQENKNFKGSLSDFIKKIKECNHYYDIQDDKITERLVRYYITQSIIPRPKRDGKEFFYLYEHLLKFLYARKQIMDGWPLSKLKEMMKFEENQYFEDFFNTSFKTDSSNDSMSLIKSFKSESKNLSEKKVNQILNPIKHQERKDIPNLKEALFQINADLGNVVKQEFTVLELASWLILQIEKNKLSGMTYELSRKIGDAISAALIERNPMTTQELQAQFNKNQEFEKLKYDMEKLSRENEYLRHKVEEEKQENYKVKNFKADAIAKLKDVFERSIEGVYSTSLQNTHSIIQVVDELRRVDPQNPEINKFMNLIAIAQEATEKQHRVSFHTINEDIEKLQMELDKTSKS